MRSITGSVVWDNLGIVDACGLERTKVVDCKIPLVWVGSKSPGKRVRSKPPRTTSITIFPESCHRCRSLVGILSAKACESVALLCYALRHICANACEWVIFMFLIEKSTPITMPHYKYRSLLELPSEVPCAPSNSMPEKLYWRGMAVIKSLLPYDTIIFTNQA